MIEAMTQAGDSEDLFVENETMSAKGVHLSVEALSAYYGNTRAVSNVTLEFPARAVTAIIGPSGCGKSTLLRCLNRLHEVTRGAKVQGRVFLDGQDLYRSSISVVEVRRRIGMVFQKPNPFPTMSIFDNVAVGLKLNGMRDRNEVEQTVIRSLKMAALWEEVKDQLGKSGASISSGQQQRLCLARALAVKPQVLLMDEPCSALDPISTARIEQLIHELKQDYTVVIVTHNMQQAARISDYTAFMYLGEIVEFAETLELFQRPKQKQTEDYVKGRFG